MSQDDRDTDTPGLRIGDLERDQAITELREQYALGRLDHEEFQQRLEAAVAARTASDLRVLLADLPAASGAVDWRSGASAPRHGSVRPDGRPYAGSDPGAGHRHPHEGHDELRRRHGHHPGHPHRGPGLLPLVPVVGLLLIVGGWSVMALMPLLFGGMVFSAALRGRCG